MLALNAKNLEPGAVRVEPVWLAHLLEAVEQGTISGTMAKEVFAEAVERQCDPQQIIQEKGLRQIVDAVALEQLADQVLSANEKSVQDYRQGKQNALMFLVGQCMARSKGAAHPQQITDILKRKLNGSKETVA